MTHTKTTSWIIEGITTGGRKFRPSNWAERLSELLVTIDHSGVPLYHPELRPIHRDDGQALFASHALQAEHPAVWEQISAFARLHDLRVTAHTVEHIHPMAAYIQNFHRQSEEYLLRA